MDSQKSRKIIAKFSTLLEAEAALTSLEASGISALIDNEITASMMPHASDAFGGFHLSVDAENAEEALQILQGASPDESMGARQPLSNSWKVRQDMRRATYGAVMGCLFLPLLANIFSLLLFKRAYQIDRKEFWDNKFLLFVGATFNLGGILLTCVLLREVFK